MNNNVDVLVLYNFFKKIFEIYKSLSKYLSEGVLLYLILNLILLENKTRC